MTRAAVRPRLVAACAVWGLLVGCQSGPAGPRDPTDAQVRAAVAGYLHDARAEIAVLSLTTHHVGLYVRGTPAWSLDEFVRQLPSAAETARMLLTRFPALTDADVCGDGPWLPHPDATSFVPAVRVVVFRDRAAALPERFREPADVLDAGLRAKSIDFYVDPRIIRESAAYRAAFRELGSRYRKG